MSHYNSRKIEKKSTVQIFCSSYWYQFFFLNCKYSTHVKLPFGCNKKNQRDWMGFENYDLVKVLLTKEELILDPKMLVFP